MAVFFCKKVDNGGCFVKSGPFLNAWCIMYSISIFILHYTHSGVRTHPTHPLPTGLVCVLRHLDVLISHGYFDTVGWTSGRVSGLE